jgi:DNA-directed RNA polymerase specialized sigma subunit
MARTEGVRQVSRVNIAERRQKMRDMYEEGYSLQEICDELGYKTTDYVEYALRKMGVYRADEFGIDVPKVKALKAAGWTMQQIIAEFGHRYTATEINKALALERERRKQKPDG